MTRSCACCGACSGIWTSRLQVCADADSALYRLTRRRFEGIIVDCAADGASQVLRSARSAPCNKQAVAVAIVEPAVGLREVFALGAHFVLYKPVSGERVKSSFRAARALMKSERRRNARVAVEIPVTMQDPTLGDSMRVTTIDVSEGGMAVRLPKRRRPSGRWQISFCTARNPEPHRSASGVCLGRRSGTSGAALPGDFSGGNAAATGMAPAELIRGRT